MEAMMHALVFEQAGPAADVLSLRSVPKPTPRPGEALVRVEARPMHPADFMFIAGRYRIRPAPLQVAGLEGTGIVESVGSASASALLGRRVAFRHPGTWASCVAVPLDKLHAVPEGVPREAAAQFSLNPPTAWALLDELVLKSGDWIAMNAATSSVAQMVRELARSRGMRVVSIVRPGSSALQADAVLVDDGRVRLADAALELSGGAPLAGLLDCIGGGAVTGLLGALRQGATIVSYGVLEQTPASVQNADLIYRNLTWKGFGIDHWLSSHHDRHEAMVQELWLAIASGTLTMPIHSSHALGDFQPALAAARAAGGRGKVLLEGD